MTLTYDDIAETALAWHKAGRPVALATVVETWGSAPRPVGSQLAIASDGDMVGSVSGGCVEGAVIVEAQDALEDGQTRILEYGITNDEAFAVGLACGGRIRVMVEPVGAAIDVGILQAICDARAERRAVAYVVHTTDWQRRLINGDAGALADRFRSDKSGFEGDEFVLIHNPPLRMAVVGAVHIAQPLLIMAGLAGYDTVLIDPRDAFASKGRFPDAKIVHDWPDEALQDFDLDARTAVVTLTHDPKLDDPAIVTALNSAVFYLGSLGSTRTHSKRLARMAEAGFREEQLDRIHAPVGLDIGSKSPAEIAISIMAEITAVLRQSTK